MGENYDVFCLRKLTVVWILLSVSFSHLGYGTVQNCTLRYRPNLLCDVTETAICPMLERVPDKLPPPPPFNFTMGTFIDHKKIFNTKANKTISYLLPGLRLTWTAPHHSGARDIKGFELALLIIGGRKVGQSQCLTFNLTGTIMEPQVQFEYTLFPVQYVAEFYAKLYSLPKPDPNWDEKSYVDQLVKTPSYMTEDFPVSSTWVFGLNFMNNSCKRQISCSFTIPPEVLNFTHVDVKLARPGEFNSLDSVRVKLPRNHATFEGVQPGTYILLLEIVDEKPFDPHHCLCRDKNAQCSRCIVTKSSNFTISSNLTGCPIEGEISSSASPSVSETKEVPVDNGDYEDWKSIIGPVIGILVAIILIGILVLILKKYGRVCWGRKPPDYGASEEVKVPPGNLPVNNNILIETEPVLKERVIYLVYTDDNSYHQRAVKLLAQYLKKYCKCSVLFPPYCLQEIQAKRTIRWVLESIQKADYVLIINSEGSFNLNKAHNENKPPCNFSDSPMGDIFTPAIDNIINNFYKEQDYKKYIMTLFSYSEDKFQIREIPTGFKYSLMKHFRELLCHIHELNPEKPGLQSQFLPLHSDDHEKTVEGRELLQAIEETAAFIKTYPDWFNSMYSTEDDGQCDSGVSSLPLDSFTDHLKEKIQRECQKNLSSAPNDKDIALPTDLHHGFIPSYNGQDSMSLTQSQVTFVAPDLYSVYTGIGLQGGQLQPCMEESELGAHPIYGNQGKTTLGIQPEYQYQFSHADSGRSSQYSANSRYDGAQGLFNVTDHLEPIGCDSISTACHQIESDAPISLWDAGEIEDGRSPVVVIDNISLGAVSI